MIVDVCVPDADLIIHGWQGETSETRSYIGVRGIRHDEQRDMGHDFWRSCSMKKEKKLNR